MVYIESVAAEVRLIACVMRAGCVFFYVLVAHLAFLLSFPLALVWTKEYHVMRMHSNDEELFEIFKRNLYMREKV